MSIDMFTLRQLIEDDDSCSSIYCLKRRSLLSTADCHIVHLTGGDLGGDWGTVHPEFEVGDDPCIRPPQYFANYCYWLWDKLRSPVGISGGNIEAFREERVDRYCSSVWDRRDRQSRQSWVDDWKGSSEIFRHKIEICSWKGHSEILTENFFRPPKLSAKSPPMVHLQCCVKGFAVLPSASLSFYAIYYCLLQHMWIAHMHELVVHEKMTSSWIGH